MKENIFCKVKKGDPAALAILYADLKARFFWQILRELHDVNDAQDVFHTAIRNLLEAIQNDKVVWLGEAQFYKYCRTTIHNAAKDFLRDVKKHGPVLPEPVTEVDGKPETDSSGERLPVRPKTLMKVAAHLVPDPQEEEERTKLWSIIYAEALSACSPQERRIFQAYEVLAKTPGSEKWTKHQRTQYVRNAVGLTPSAFWPAHSRFRKKMEKLLLTHNVLRQNAKTYG